MIPETLYRLWERQRQMALAAERTRLAHEALARARAVQAVLRVT